MTPSLFTPGVVNDRNDHNDTPCLNETERIGLLTFFVISKKFIWVTFHMAPPPYSLIFTNGYLIEVN